MRIVGGKWRGRTLISPQDRSVRPTTDRVREAAFNILSHAPWAAQDDGRSALEGALVLDVFCGTGALGLEALSRGARKAAFMDNTPASLNLVRQNLAQIGPEAQATATLIRADALKPPKPPFAATLVFLDPPYAKSSEMPDLASPALTALRTSGWITPGAICVTELPQAQTQWQCPDCFAEKERRKYGDTVVCFLQTS